MHPKTAKKVAESHQFEMSYEPIFHRWRLVRRHTRSDGLGHTVTPRQIRDMDQGQFAAMLLRIRDGEENALLEGDDTV